MRLVTLFCMGLLVFSPSLGEALTFTQTGAVVTATYTEPTTNADTPPTPLTDLASTNVYFQILGQTAVKGPAVPATAATGGGAITTTVTVPIVAGQQADVNFWATATDKSGNESVRSVETILRIDRLPPGAPK